MNSKELYNFQEAYLNIYEGYEIYTEALKHPASSGLKPEAQNLVMKN